MHSPLRGPVGQMCGSLKARIVRYLLACVMLTLLLAMAQAQTRAGAAWAADATFQALASITNDRNPDLQSLGVVLNAGRIVGLRFDAISGDDPHESKFSIPDIRAGAVLDGDAKHEAVVLRGSIDSRMGKADLVITYLSNGLFGKHKECRARMVRDERGRWHIVNSYDHRRVTQLVVRTWALGISTIEGICPRRAERS